MVEVEEIVNPPSDADLTQLDGTLRLFVTFCAAYHGESHPNFSESVSANE